MKKIDVIVIGTGSGSMAAHRCAAAGKKTAIIDSQSFWRNMRIDEDAIRKKCW